MKQVVKPLEDKLLLKKIESPETSAHGVIMPDIAQEGANMGEVIAVGPGRLMIDGKRIPNECQVGDKVMYLKFEAHKIDFEDEEYMVIRESNVLVRYIIDPVEELVTAIDKKELKTVLDEIKHESNGQPLIPSDPEAEKVLEEYAKGIDTEKVIIKDPVFISELHSEPITI